MKLIAIAKGGEHDFYHFSETKMVELVSYIVM